MVYDNTVQGQVSLSTNGKVTREQAVRLIEDALFLNGFLLVDSADGATVKVIGLAKSVRGEGVPIYNTLDDLPKRERIVSYVARVKRADALRLTGVLQQYVPPGPGTSFTPVPGGMIILTARTSMIRSLVKLLETMDVPAGDEPAVVLPPVPDAPPVVLPSGRPAATGIFTAPGSLHGPIRGLPPVKPTPANDDD